MKLMLATITIKETEREIPGVCPHCGEDLTDGALRMAYLRDEFHTARPDKDGDVESTGDVDLGDTFLATAVWCRQCDTVLAGGDIQVAK